MPRSNSAAPFFARCVNPFMLSSGIPALKRIPSPIPHENHSNNHGSSPKTSYS
ncbi:hypothetical protein WCP94_000516 (plasmid) [Bilophila wadsworthia]